MQGNGFKLFVAVFFLALSLYYLYPTFQYYRVEKKMEQMSPEEREAYLRENFSKIKSWKERALKLGLDLQGGMHVTLEVEVDALIRELAVERDSLFNSVLEAARIRADKEGKDFVDAFYEEFLARDPNVRLSRYFRNPDAGITRRSSNDEVIAYLKREAEAAVIRAIEIIRDRVDRFGVTEPSIQRQGSRRIVVELPGVNDPERVRKLLKGTARLEFRLMADPQEVATTLQRLIDYYQQQVEEDTTAVDSLSAEALLEEESQKNPLLKVLQPIGQGVVLGAAIEQDTAAVNALLRNPEVQELIPPDITFLWTAKPVGTTSDGHEIYYLLGVRKDVELTGDVIVDARVDFDPFTNQPEVTIVMNSEGARIWARITGANIGKPIAIVLDNVVYSYPVVQAKIVGGRSSITGLESVEEAEDIVTILKSGALPAPVTIIEERTVGPSLGEASIRAGTISLVVGLLLVLGFMILYYGLAGAVADFALLLNIIFIFGILAAFGATLTLPGIAGIVLTIGMAVDANVLIFERIREEQKAGRTLKAAIDAGYSKALSAIADANITTFLVGAILYSFGVGPIQGFAVTLMAGIVSSLFTAIVVTRLIFDYLVVEKRKIISFG